MEHFVDEKIYAIMIVGEKIESTGTHRFYSKR